MSQLNEGIILGLAVVLTYTIWGGMWSVALHGSLPVVVIIGGLSAIAWLVTDMTGGAGRVVIAHADEAGKFEFWPKGERAEWLAFVAAWLTLRWARYRSRTCSSA